MAQRFKVLVLGGVLLGLAGSASTTHASMSDRTMYLTFSGAVALPGVELRAGTYIFELASPENNLSLVRVTSRDHHKIYLTAFTNIVDRPANLKAGQVVALGEAAAGAAPPIKVWFPAGAEQGREFIYRN